MMTSRGISSSIGRIVASVLVLCVGGAGIAATIYVDASNQTGVEDGSLANPWNTIQEGIDAAVNGDQVRVAPGTYRESLLMEDGVSVFGADPLTTIIDGTGEQNSVVTFEATRFSPRLDGFTVTGGEGDQRGVVGNTPLFVGGGIYVSNSAPIITHNLITLNSVTEGIARGAGIYVNTAITGYTPQITGNVISYNTAVSADEPDEGEGGGIYVNSKTASVIISDNLIEFNQARRGGGLFNQNSGSASASIQRNVVRYNQAEDGAGIFSRDFTDSSTAIVNNLLYGNGSSATGIRDCDDGDANSNPGLAEVCGDGVDNDCDPTTPDLFDADGDGSPCDLDCDDADPTRSPLVAEKCDDGIDNDCDGSIDIASPENVVLVQFDSPMTYLTNSIDPGLGLTWIDAAFDDSGWTPGIYGVGFELSSTGANDLIQTDVASDAASVYSRATFEISSVADVNTLFVGADYDDGYVMWINGVEVARSPEMPAGDPAWNAQPTGRESSNGATPDYGTLIDVSTAGIPALVDGTNVFAVGLYQDLPGASSDLVIVPRLSMSFGTDDADCLCADNDADGYACTDCADADAAVNPGVLEVCGDSLDNDCDVGTPDVVDADGDGFTCVIDCDDSDFAIKPSAAEVYCDGLDNDCNAVTPDVFDADGDFFDCDVDCDDGNPAIKPNALEFCFDAIDNNCDGFTDDADDECACPSPVDVDADGYRCTDCNDGDPQVNPAANEICNDGKDNDCDSATDDIFDGDGDGELCDVDCLDTDAAVNSGAIEICNDGIDNDCDLDTDGADTDCQGCPDDDGDGYPGGTCAVDCDDSLGNVNPGEVEVCNDGLDNDCDPATLDIDDVDGDGFDCTLDCDDSDAAVNSGVFEVCNDLIDNNCDGLIDSLDPDLVLVEFGSPMLYVTGDTDPGLGISWTVESFDDTTWTNGVYGVGYQVGPPGSGAEDLIATEVFEGATFVYTRARFTITDVAGVNSMTLGADYDDGYVAWVNGVEVYRSPEMPPGTPVWDADPALHESSNGQVPDYGTLIDISASAIPVLHTGLNVLAVGIYNDFPEMGGASSDLVVVPRLAMSFGADDPECLCEDFDGDGYVGGSCAIDCDDTTAEIHPGLPEIGCDLIDNDCDPATTDVLDVDGDGSTCDLDCDDDNADVYPGNTEIPCDFLDNDCNSDTAEVVDADNDTFDCYQDCDDDNIAINPLATEQPCDGIDNDCSTLTADIQDVDGDGSFCDVDCDDADPAINPGAAEHCTDGVDNDCDTLQDAADTTECSCADVDGDGYACLDCADGDAAVNPGAAEVCNDTIDNDCDPATPDLFDNDDDTFDCTLDCDDDDSSISPAMDEICNDTIDNDCDPGTLDIFDADGDTHDCIADCDDSNAAINPDATEACNDGVDNDCDPGTLDIVDGDGDTYDCSFDCDDTAAAVNPGETEVCNDGIDNDCNPSTPDLLDLDGDGTTCDLDCDDDDATRSLTTLEICDDGVDNDCDTLTDIADVADCGCGDVDGDGYSCTDCDDSVATTNPGAPEICNDTFDNDCNPATLDFDDVDGDGYFCDTDCDDDDASVNPAASEICNDSIDNDCNPATVDLFDIDGDTYTCDVDCNDDDVSINPGIAEVGCDGLDNDCDPLTTDLADDDADTYSCIDVTIRGGAISAGAFGTGTLSIINNTIVDNSLPFGIGAGIWVDDLVSTIPGIVSNNILSGNVAEIGGGVDHTAFFGDLTHNVLYNNTAGDLYDAGGSGATRTSNQFIDPQFSSPSTDNFRLSPDSPLIDAADPASAPLNDLDRFFRPFDGDGDLNPVADIGAYEYPSGEVFNLVFVGFDELSWDERPQDPQYSLYRGWMRTLRLQGLYTQNPTQPTAAQFCGIPSGTLPFVDTYTPPEGEVVFYVVVVSGASFEGSLGEDSEGRIRPNAFPCP